MTLEIGLLVHYSASLIIYHLNELSTPLSCSLHDQTNHSSTSNILHQRSRNHHVDSHNFDCWHALLLHGHLQQKLDLFKQTGSVFHSGKALFEDSWQQVMLGQGLTPERYHPFADTMEQAELADFLSHVSGTIQRTVATMPDHERYIATMQ